MRCARGKLGILLLGATLVLWAKSGRAADSAPAFGPEAEAEKLVRQALVEEIKGDREERTRLLQQALRISPDYAPAHWHLGEFQRDKKWCTPGDVAILSLTNPKRQQYHQLRSTSVPSLETEVALARFCKRAGLLEEERLHWLAVLSYAPGHREAALALKLKKYKGRYFTPEQLQLVKNEEARLEAAKNRWQKKLESLANTIETTTDEEHDKALAELRTVDDLDAIFWLEKLVSRRSPELGLESVGILAKHRESAATESLVRHVLFSQFEEVRQAAIAELKERPIETYAGPLVQSLTSPPDVELNVDYHPGGVGLPRVVQISVEGTIERFDDVLEVASSFRGVSFIGGFSPDAMQLDRRRGELARSIHTSEIINQRICELLAEASGQEFGRDEKEWWNWWCELNQLSRGDSKPKYRIGGDAFAIEIPKMDQIYSPQASSAARPQGSPATPQTSGKVVSNASRPASGGLLYNGIFGVPKPLPPPPRRICFRGDTLVHTTRGEVPIKDIRVGDFVLSQNVDTGEIGYQPVMLTTLRPSASMVTLVVGDEQIVATKGHLFWVVGAGWRMASVLSSKDRLHSLDGSIAVKQIAPADDEPAYNLVLPEWNTYFVGESMLLVHDNTPTRATDSVIPGLTYSAWKAATATAP